MHGKVHLRSLLGNTGVKIPLFLAPKCDLATREYRTIRAFNIILTLSTVLPPITPKISYKTMNTDNQTIERNLIILKEYVDQAQIEFKTRQLKQLDLSIQLIRQVSKHLSELTENVG